MPIESPLDLQGNGTFERELQMAAYMYGSMGEYFAAFMNAKKSEPYLKSERFMKKSISSMRLMYEKQMGIKSPEPEQVQQYDDDHGFPIF